MTLLPSIHRRSAHVRSRAWALSFIAWALVGFYLLASARALVPGLCATQAAMDAQCHVDQSAIAKPAHGCCPAPDGDGDSTPVTPADSQCAFCNLLIAHTDAPLILALTAIPEAVHAETITHDFQQAQEVNFAAAPNRAPPA